MPRTSRRDGEEPRRGAREPGRERGREPGRRGGRRPAASSGAASSGAAADDATSSPRGFGRAFAEPPKPLRPSLSRERVVDAAVTVLDAEGADALTFRRLASELEVGVASLYWHVESKDVLLDLALDQLLAGITTPDRPPAGIAWQDEIRGTGIRIYRTFLAHGWAAGQMMRSSDRGPNVLRLWEYVTEVLNGAGFTPEQSFNGLSLLFNHVLASGVQEAIWDPTGRMEPVERERQMREMGRFLGGLDPDRFPAIIAIAGNFGRHDQGEQFADCLDLIIEGLEQRLARRSGI